ncbi:hypothetical protein D9M68_856380 [compost metagenome]
MPEAGIAPPCAETKSIRPKLRLCTRGWAAMSKARCTAAGDSISTCSGKAVAPAASSAATARSTSATDSTLGTIRCVKRAPACPAMVVTSASKAGWSTGCTRTATRASGAAPSASPVTSAA